MRLCAEKEKRLCAEKEKRLCAYCFIQKKKKEVVCQKEAVCLLKL